ncbi:MAG: EAL domain-containing protein [Gammaproteobacteria bacterium]|nr:MAG: EAL domain-containing protein [Gammaproteobacteria bacterium]
MTAAETAHIHRSYLAWAGASLLLMPAVGIAAAGLLGLAPPARLLDARLLAGVVLVWALGLWEHQRFLAPLLEGIHRQVAGDGGERPPSALSDRLRAFGRRWWLPFLLLGLVLPLLLTWPEVAPRRLLHLWLLEGALAYLFGLPGYLHGLDLLGRLVPWLGLRAVHGHLHNRIALLAGLAPLLALALLLQYHGLHQGRVEGPLWALFALVAGTLLAATVLAIRGMRQALQPVQEVLGRSGASSHGELADLRPRSTDEIGYLTQTLGKLFRRLGDQESYMHAIVDTAAEGIIVVDDRGRIDTFNPAAEHLFGYLSAEIRGKPLAWLLPDIVAEGEPPPITLSECETRGLHRNGRPIPVSIRVSEMQAEGRTLYTCLVADITQRKEAEENLRQAEARYRDLVETAHDLVWSMDPDGHWRYVNGACLAIYGYTPQEMVGRPLAEFQSPDTRERDQQAFAEVLAGHELVQYETVHLDRHGNRHHLSFNARPHLDATGRVVRISGTARDITEQKAFQEQLAYQAEHDSLTGLFNRHYFQEELERTVARVARNGAPCGLFYIDLDQFKYINDTLGHAAGDRLLIEISRLLEAHVREGDLLARFGGDEFTLLVYNVGMAQLARVGENFRALFDDYTFYYDGKGFNVTCSLGGALIDRSIRSADEALAHADLACNMAKTEGRNRVHLYVPEDKDKAGMAEDMGWAARVREMLEHDRFQLVFQPIARIADGAVEDYEVLVRMVCDDGSVILPGGFMPAAERFGLIHAVDRWIVAHAIDTLARLHAEGRRVRFSINLSGKAFEDEQLLPLIRIRLEASGLDPAALTFEITETAAIANLVAAERFLAELKRIGCLFALDDFGSGFSSFTYLKHLPVDKLKIDGSFVQGMVHERVDQAMVQSVNQVAHALGKVTIAEYVEDEATLRLLRSYGVDYAQGNHVGEPLDLERLYATRLPDNVLPLQQ